MACSSSSASLLPTRPRKFDLYLSFRGEDTGGGFTDHLYNALDRKGIVAFRDDNNDLEEETNITSEVILGAIEISKVAVVVVSENYASSRRCLKELVKILECRNKMDMKVFPIYYKVDLGDVRSQTGSFEKAFLKHEAMYGEDNFEVQQWRKALIEIANLTGWVCNDWARKPEVIKDICDAILRIIKSTFEEEILIRFTSSTDDFDYFYDRFGWLPDEYRDEKSMIYRRMTKNARVRTLLQLVEAKSIDSQVKQVTKTSSSTRHQEIEPEENLKDELLENEKQKEKVKETLDYCSGSSMEAYTYSQETNIEDELCKEKRHKMKEKKIDCRDYSGSAIESNGGESSVIDIAPPDETITTFQPSIKVRRSWEIRRYIVMGGLMESITSLVIITAATAANISNENILTLALTNLITGLFIIRHEISELQKKESRIDKRYSRNKLKGNYYKKVVKEKMYYVLNFIIAFLSFLGFGLVAPLVDALLSLQITNKNMKMIAVAGASLTCTTFLAIQKAHILKPKSRDVYVKTAATYIWVGVGAFVISYLAGNMFGNLLQ